MTAPLSQTLDAELTMLQMDTANFGVLQKITREHERRIMVNAYLWWLQADAVAGYLESCYQHNHVPYNQTKQVNFRPLVRLIYKNSVQKTDLDLWAAALRKVHEEVQSNPKHYAQDPVRDINYYIKTNGGKAGLAGYHAKATGQAVAEADDDDELWDDELQLFNLDERELVLALRQQARDFYSTNPQRPTVSTPALLHNEGGYSVVLMHKDGSTVRLVGSCSDQELIDAALVKTYRDDMTAQPMTVRSVLEPLHVMNTPRTAANAYQRYLPNTIVKDPWSSKSAKLKSQRRLTYRAQTQDFLLSYTGVNASVVIISKPRSGVMPKPRDAQQGDVFLMHSARQSVERRLLHQSVYNLFEASAKNTFHAVPQGFIAAAYLSFTTRVPVADSGGITAAQVMAVTENLSHPPLSWIPYYSSMGQPLWQTCYDNTEFSPDWAATMTLDCLRELTLAFLEPWIENRGQQCNRENNQTVMLSLDGTGWTLQFDFEPGVGYSQHINQALPVAYSGDTATALRVLTVDWLFVMRQLADLNIVGDIEMCADKHAMVLNFATDANQMQCWIPACDVKGQRDNTHFVAYTPEMTDGFAWDDSDPEDLIEEPSDEDNQRLRENMLRLKR